MTKRSVTTRLITTSKRRLQPQPQPRRASRKQSAGTILVRVAVARNTRSAAALRSVMFRLDSRGNYQLSRWAEYPWLEHGFGTRASGQWTPEAETATLKQIH